MLTTAAGREYVRISRDSPTRSRKAKGVRVTTRTRLPVKSMTNGDKASDLTAQPSFTV